MPKCNRPKYDRLEKRKSIHTEWNTPENKINNEQMKPIFIVIIWLTLSKMAVLMLKQTKL